MQIFKTWQQKNRSLPLRILTLILAGFVFLYLFPWILLVGSPRLDAGLGLPPFPSGLLNLILGAILIISGGAFAFWSVLAEVITGEGTPVPAVPTRWLVVGGPFRYCRNPMTLGTLTTYLGVAIIGTSVSGVILVVLFGLALVAYIKGVEEKELEARFGESYLAYKRSVPFLIPNIRQTKQSQ